jgi:hypothetical protein
MGHATHHIVIILFLAMSLSSAVSQPTLTGRPWLRHY